MKKAIRIFLGSALVMVATIGLSNPPTGSGPTTGEDPDNDTPIDGGIGLLVAAGVAFGARQFVKKK